MQQVIHEMQLIHEIQVIQLIQETQEMPLNADISIRLVNSVYTVRCSN